MQRLIWLITFFILIPLHSNGAADPNSSSPIIGHVGGLIQSGVNWFYKTVDPYYPMVPADYMTGPDTVACLRAKEVAMELDFATETPQTYREYTGDYDITTRFADRAGPTNRRLVEWLASGNSEQLKACYDCIYNLSPLFRLLLELYWTEHEVYRPATIEQTDYGVFETVNPFLSEPVKSAIELETVITESRKIIAAQSQENTLSAAERKKNRRLYPEDFLRNPGEVRKHLALYGLAEASANLARINKQPPVALLAKQLEQTIKQIACREYYIRQVAISLLQAGAFDRMKEIYQIHRKNIPPVLAVMICDMLRTNCIDAPDYLPRAYLDYYNTQTLPVCPVGVDPMLFKAAPKFIFLLCNDLTAKERSTLYSAKEKILHSHNRSAEIWASIGFSDTRRSLLTRIEQTDNMPQLFARLGKMMGLPTGEPSTDTASAPISPSMSLFNSASPDTQWDLDTHQMQPFETLQEGFMHPRLDSVTALPPILELPKEFIPGQEQPQ